MRTLYFLNRKNITATFLHFLIAIFIGFQVKCQTPNDALMMPARNICILLGYDTGQFDRYWEGERLRNNETIAKVDRDVIMPMIAVGIVNDLNFFVGVPYVQTESSENNGGRLAGVNGFQDIGFALKYKALDKNIGIGQLRLLTSVGYSTPVSNYLSDYLPYSIGFGAPEFALRGIAQYKLDKGFYIRGMLAHLWRGYAEVERDYYYNNGSYYSSYMDVPNAWNFEGIVGNWFLNNTLKLEMNYNGLRSTSGDDIRAYNAAQPTNKVNTDRVGISLQYYLPFIKGLGLVAYHNRTVDGLNSAKYNNTGAGLTYQFDFINDKTDEANAQ